MNHFAIVCATSVNGRLEFSHFNHDAPAGTWIKENIITTDCIKINVFIEGTFSVFSDGVLHTPMYGDVCILSPMKMHYGQIKEPMHINYYQIDVGTKIFDRIPKGEVLLARLMSLADDSGSFFRPEPSDRSAAIELCKSIESAIAENEIYKAYAKVIELLSFLSGMRFASKRGGVGLHSLRITQALHYIEEKYAENISLKTIADELGVSASFLSRIFKKEIGVTVHDYLNRYRILRAVERLKSCSVTECGYLCGFCDTSHFISVFKKYMNLTPMQYKNSKV